jgi:CheY-like chemotaxis protein
MTASIDTEGTDEPAPKIVLIVDDDPLILTTMRDGLQRAGYDVWSAASA